jgi:AraC-like DNA-binding protein
MIITLDKHPRKSIVTPPLERVGLLYNKNYTITRKFGKFSVSFILTGNGFLTQNGETIELKSPVAVLNHEGEEKSYGPHTKWDEFYFGYNKGAENSLQQILPTEIFLKKTWPICNFKVFNRYLNLMLTTINENRFKTTCDQLDLLAFGMLIESFFSSAIESISPSEKQLFAAENWIINNIDKDIDVKKIAAEFGFSYSTFRRLWKKQFNTSPYDYILKLKNTEAIRLLEETKLPISNISQKLGFKDQCYFSRFFMRMNALSPSEYRKDIAGIIY